MLFDARSIVCLPILITGCLLAPWASPERYDGLLRDVAEDGLVRLTVAAVGSGTRLQPYTASTTIMPLTVPVVEPAPESAGPAHSGRPVDPGTATTRALFFPGGGHFFTGERGRGAVLLGGAVGATALGFMLSSSEGGYNHETHSYEEANRVPLVLGLGTAAALWVYGVLDAGSSARRVNARNGFEVGAVRMEPRPLFDLAPNGSPALGVGLRITH